MQKRISRIQVFEAKNMPGRQEAAVRVVRNGGIEGDPHCVIEGLAIAAVAVGAEEGFFYIRDEYDLAVRHVKKAIEDAKAGHDRYG